MLIETDSETLGEPVYIFPNVTPELPLFPSFKTQGISFSLFLYLPPQPLISSHPVKARHREKPRFAPRDEILYQLVTGGEGANRNVQA